MKPDETTLLISQLLPCLLLHNHSQLNQAPAFTQWGWLLLWYEEWMSPSKTWYTLCFKKVFIFY